MPFELAAVVLFEVTYAPHLVHADQAERPALLVGAAGAADAVHVHLGIGRDLDIDHGFQLRDIQPARGHVGGNQHRAAAIGKLHQHLVAIALLQVAMQCQRLVALRAQQLHQFAAARLGIAERQRAGRAEMVEQPPDRTQALAFLHFIEALADGGVVVRRFQLQRLRLAQELVGELVDAFGIRRREQQRLAFLRATAGDVGDIVEEAHVEHAVGFIEHQRVDRRQVQAAAIDMIKNAARRTHHNMRAVNKAIHLRAHRGAAAQRQHLDVLFGAREAADFLRDLVGQLARGAQHHRLHVEAARIKPVQQRQPEGGGLAAAGLGLCHQVLARQCDRQAGRLDRRHFVIAKLRQRGEHGGRQRQGGKSGAGLRLGGGRVHARL
ncbi:hypothetical protein D9M72_232970 [compost metagenome]